jgi:hypothetical protein
MSLLKFQKTLYEKFNDLLNKEGNRDMKDFIDSYVEAEQKEYTNNKNNGKLTFGKYKGYSIDELAKTDKGKDYLSWLSAQSFFTEGKFDELKEKLNELGIKKKKLNS